MSGEELFATIVCKHYDSLFRFALSLTHTEPEAGDLTQQTFYVWAKKGEQLRDSTKVKSWLFTTLHRLFLETQRRQAKFPHDNLDEVQEQLSTESVRFDRADSLTVISALARIDEVYRAAVALFYLEDCSYKEIARILEIPVGTVRSRIARGIRKLRAILLPGGSLQGRSGRGAGLQNTLLGPSSVRNRLTTGEDLSLSL